MTDACRYCKESFGLHLLSCPMAVTLKRKSRRRPSIRPGRTGGFTFGAGGTEYAGDRA